MYGENSGGVSSRPEWEKAREAEPAHVDNVVARTHPGAIKNFPVSVITGRDSGPY